MAGPMGSGISISSLWYITGLATVISTPVFFLIQLVYVKVSKWISVLTNQIFCINSRIDEEFDRLVQKPYSELNVIRCHD